MGLAGMVAAAAMVVAAVVTVGEMPYTAAGAVYKVGDDKGWTSLGKINYKEWAANKTFSIGDTILFEYDSQFHNVMRVTHAEYRACNASTPISTFNTGNDTFQVKTRGHHYFMCGIPGHCEAGQKVDINVFSTNSPATVPSPSGSSSVSTPSRAKAPKAPAPSPNDAAPLGALKGNLGFPAMVFAGFVCALA